MPQEHEQQQRYRERPSRLPGAVVWTWDAPDHPPRKPRSVLPDGCMDLIWTGGRIVVAGPDTHAFEVEPQNRASCAAIRLAPGTAPVLLGVPAHELRDHRADLADLWPSAAVRRLTDRIDRAPDPAAALERFALDRIADTGPRTRGRSPSPKACAGAVRSRRRRRRPDSAPASSTAAPWPPSATAPRRWPASSASNAPWSSSAPASRTPKRPARQAAPTRRTSPARCATWPERPSGPTSRRRQATRRRPRTARPRTRPDPAPPRSAAPTPRPTASGAPRTRRR